MATHTEEWHTLATLDPFQFYTTGFDTLAAMAIAFDAIEALADGAWTDTERAWFRSPLGAMCAVQS